jgi:hypothetical protein
MAITKRPVKALTGILVDYVAQLLHNSAKVSRFFERSGAEKIAKQFPIERSEFIILRMHL